MNYKYKTAEVLNKIENKIKEIYNLNYNSPENYDFLFYLAVSKMLKDIENTVKFIEHDIKN